MSGLSARTDLPTSPSLEAPLDPQGSAVLGSNNDTRLRWAFRWSWLVNWFLLGAKIYAFVATGSKAVLASLADSAVDLASQGVIAIAEHFMRRSSPQYPVGRARLEALGVIGCACIMSIASLEVLQYSVIDLVNGFGKGQLPELETGAAMYAILGGGTFAKFLLWLYCRSVQGSDSMVALAEDHLNDVMSNTGAIVMVTAAFYWHKGWWLDPIGAIIIALVIIYRWIHMTSEQVKKIVGRAAPASFIQVVEELAEGHHEQVRVDCTRAYHFGARYNVELEIVLPGDMTVIESHDIALALQHKIEALEAVERAFVHVDYQQRDQPEHKVERTLLLNAAQRQHSRKWGRRKPAVSAPDAATAAAAVTQTNQQLAAVHSTQQAGVHDSAARRVASAPADQLVEVV